MTTALVVLTLNEIDGMKQVMPKIEKTWVDEIIVVDGGSTDGTIDEAIKMGLKIIPQEEKGHGGAILAGVKATNSEYIVFFGPDGNHEPEEIPKLIEKIHEGFDQVIISRFGKTSINLDAGKLDSFGNKMFTFFVNLFFKGNLTDSLNESRIITRKAMEQLNFDAFGLDSTLQMSIRGLKNKQRFAEIVGNEGKRIGGERKINSFGTGVLLMKRIIKEILSV
jgi:glycosyltransferase involved in cell wall biosynthesis